jgi:putative inorganic carbon (hco3(-)) transporter
MSAAARAIGRPDIAGAPVVLALALATGAAAVRSPQLAVAISLLVLLFAVRAQSRTGGLIVLWSYWLLTPAIRRLLELMGSAPAADPLSLMPFVATGILALMELQANRLDRRARTIVVLAVAGVLIGVPAGMLADPASASFAAIAYCAGISAFALGWGDEVRSPRRSTLEQVLAAALPLLALYGIAQYFLPLTAWDSNWVEAGELGSLGAPQEDHIRIFATLNAPFTFAVVLGLGIIFVLGRGRRGLDNTLTVLLLTVALALTFVRSAWLALAMGLIVYVASARGRGAGRTVAVVTLCLAGLVVAGGSNPTTKAFTERLTSLGDPESDVSAQDRLEITNRLLPAAVNQPLGAGMGQTGLSSRLDESTETDLVDVDDGYLSLLYQSGPLGFLLVLIAMIAGVVAAVQALGRAPPDERLRRSALLAALVMLLVAEASADALFGVTGAIFWYLCGLSVAAASREREFRAERAANATSS